MLQYRLELSTTVVQGIHHQIDFTNLLSQYI